MPRIVLAHTDSWPHVQRGGERYLHDLGWYLANHTGATPEILTRRGQPEHDRVEQVDVHRTWRVPDLPSHRLHVAESWLAARTARGALRRVAPTLVHALMPSAAVAGRALGLPTIYTTLGAPDAAFARRSPRQWRAIEAGARAADVVTAVGRAAAAGMADLLGREVLALPPGLRPDRFRPRLDARTGPPRVLYASAVEPRNKNFRHLVAAFARLLDTHPDATLAVVGPGDVDAVLQACGAAGARVRPHVDRCLPSPDQLPDHYARATVTVLVSYGEAFGLVLAESLACGTPVVAATEGGPAEIVAGAVGQVGTVAPPEDTDALADALGDAIALAARPGAPAGCVDHARRWDWGTAVGPEHLALYERLGVEVEVAA